MQGDTALERSKLSQRILLEQENAKRIFRIKFAVSWLALIGLVLFIFSGIEINLGNYRFKAISLDLDFIRSAAPLITRGVPVTLLLSALSIFFASILALLAALGNLSNNAPIRALTTFYVSLVRGTPLLVQIFFLFLALPQMGIVLNGFVVGVVALSLNYGAYMSEIFRAGIGGVSHGQRDAALALGMTNRQMMRRIVLPQALRLVIPPVGNEFIAMLKDSALISVTGFVQEILWLAQRYGRREFRSMEALLIAALWYWVMTLIFTAIQSRIEKRLARGDR